MSNQKEHLDKLKEVYRNIYNKIDTSNSIMFAQALAALTGEPIITAIQKQPLPLEKSLYDRLLDYFCGDGYSEDDANDMLMKSKFAWEVPNSILVIEYENGNVEKVKVDAVDTVPKIVQVAYLNFNRNVVA